MLPIARQSSYVLIESRPSVQAVFLLRFLAGAWLSAPHGLPHPGLTALAAFGWFCATVAVYVFNGVADRPEDVRNGSRRPIAAGALRLPAGRAAALLGGLGAVALCCELAASGAAGVLLAAGYLLLGLLYSAGPFPLKRTYATCALGGTALGLATYTAGFLAGGRDVNAPLLVFAGFMSLWMGGVGGIAKDFSDVVGDRAAGRRSLPVVLGDTRAALLLAAVALAVALGFTLSAVRYPMPLLGCAVVLTLGAVAVSGAGRRVAGSGVRARRRLPYRVFMWTQQCAHIALGVGALAALAAS